MYICMHVCMYACMYKCMYVCMNVYMFVCMFVYVCIHMYVIDRHNAIYSYHYNSHTLQSLVLVEHISAAAQYSPPHPQGIEDLHILSRL